MVISLLHTLTRYKIWQLVIWTKSSIKCARYEGIRCLLFSDHKMISLAPETGGLSRLHFPTFLIEGFEKGRSEGICSGQILTFIKITTRVLLRQKHPKWPNELDMPTCPVWVQGESLGSYHESTLIPSYLHGSATILSLSAITSIWDHLSRYLTRVKHSVSQRPSLRNESLPRRLSLLPWLQLNCSISAIHGFNYAVRSSSLSKMCQRSNFNAGC